MNRFPWEKSQADLKLLRLFLSTKKNFVIEVSNYHPISLLSVVNKILEKLMYNRLTSYFDKFSVFYDKQFGFSPKLSTSHALILLTDKIKEAIDKGFHYCGIFLDLCKAFDTVDYVILLEKFEYFGIRGTTLK